MQRSMVEARRTLSHKGLVHSGVSCGDGAMRPMMERNRSTASHTTACLHSSEGDASSKSVAHAKQTSGVTYEN